MGGTGIGSHWGVMTKENSIAELLINSRLGHESNFVGCEEFACSRAAESDVSDFARLYC